jgi:hypothetical protein
MQVAHMQLLRGASALRHCLNPAPDLGSGRPGPPEIDEQKKNVIENFFPSHQLFFILLSPLSFPWFPWLFLPSLQRLNVKEI